MRLISASERQKVLKILVETQKRTVPNLMLDKLFFKKIRNSLNPNAHTLNRALLDSFFSDREYSSIIRII